MSAKQHQVKLSASERRTLETLLRKGTAKARMLTRARVLLLADQANTDDEIVAALGIGLATVYRLRQRFATEGLDAALQERPRPGAVRKLSEHQEARLTALVCSDAPDGRSRWSLRLLADKLVELKLVDSISHNTVGEYLKKTR
jgi:transposase